MNPNIEMITPVLWGVNSFYVKAGWTKELLPIPQPPGSATYREQRRFFNR